ncbi:MAG: decarboxylating 6-phosphogluconate dehydrogenase [Acidobacteria bacterium]|nr:decarboxylating 6-phosphogluconate dehydrogenase [Acidobacteriota bacterium]
MQLGFVGLGRMGSNMVMRLARAGHEIVVFDRNPGAVAQAAAAGLRGVDSLDALVRALLPPRAVWVMVPAGAATESTIDGLATLLAEDDVVIDGGNTRFHDDVRRARALGARGIHYVDAGTSGGIWGLADGYCLMVGGDASVCSRMEPIFTTLAPERGYLRVGGHGAGHYVKMIHNGIEYGLMQAYAEGFSLMQASEYDLDLGGIASLWMHGSVVRSWLLDLASRALADDPELARLEAHVEDSGEGRWALEEGIARAVPLPALAAALFARFRSRDESPFADRLLAALRHQFGGHAVRTHD